MFWLIKVPTGHNVFNFSKKESSELQRTGHYEVMVQISAVKLCSTSWQPDTVKCLAVTGSCQRGIILCLHRYFKRMCMRRGADKFIYIVVSVQYYGTLQVASYRITSVECKRHVAISSGKLEEVIYIYIYFFLNNTP